MVELLKRTISGIIFVVLIVFSLLMIRSSFVVYPYNYLLYIIVFSIALGGCTFEYLKLKGVNLRALRNFTIFLSVILFIFSLPHTWRFFLNFSEDGNELFFSAIICGSIVLLSFIILLIIAYTQKILNKLKYVVLAIFYTTIPFMLMNILVDTERGALLLSFFIVMWAGDVGAYCIGTAFGQGVHGHKLAPKISPKKSWEGVFGGAIFAIATALVLKYFGLLRFSDFTPSTISVILFSVIVFTLCVCGDLLESKIKRKFGVKDSGSIMPGHGGFLDRFDSMLLALPGAVIFLFFYLINIV